MTTYTTPELLAEEYRETSRRLIRQSDDEFEKGDLIQASEKAWGAASQYLKSMAALCGIQHTSHWELRLVANHIVNETRQLRIRELFAVGESLHANFYEAWMPGRGGQRRYRQHEGAVACLSVCLRRMVSYLPARLVPVPSSETAATADKPSHTISIKPKSG